MQITPISRDDIVIPSANGVAGDNRRHTMTPYFMYENVYNEVRSRIAQKPVYELKEMVEIRFAANAQYRPKFGVDEMATINEETGAVVTWAEMFKDQYQQFLAGSAQEAEGTPLEELLSYGASQANLSQCRALNIYSIEAMAHLEGAALKRAGMLGNTMKPLAKRYLEDRRDGANQQKENNELRRQLEELRAASAPAASDEEASEEEPSQYASLTDKEIKDRIADLVGQRPQGNPSRATLEQMLSGLSQQ